MDHIRDRTYNTSCAVIFSKTIHTWPEGPYSHQVVTRPLREESDSNHNSQTSPVSGSLDQTQPTDVGRDLLVEFDSSPDFLEFIFD